MGTPAFVGIVGGPCRCRSVGLAPMSTHEYHFLWYTICEQKKNSIIKRLYIVKDAYASKQSLKCTLLCCSTYVINGV